MARTEDFATLAAELEALFRGDVDASWGEGAFNAMALRVFAFQVAANPTYRRFCEGRGASLATVERWHQVPAVPATAFKFVHLSCCEHSEATFLTSGTTGGREARGRHPVASLSLYRSAALPHFRDHLNPEDRRLPILSLIPSPAQAPDSSLSAMMGFVADAWGEPMRWLGHPDSGPDVEGFVRAARHVQMAGTPALVAGTAFAFVHLTDTMARDNISVVLPPGSRLMETGGFKGRSRTMERDTLYRTLEERLGIPPRRVVNEYGMTELLSQLYEPVLRLGPAGRGVHVAPPWLRVHALDPATLDPVPAGESGLLAFFDLANLCSVSHVLTQDMGSVAPDGVRLEGRVAGAEPRGCSLALEEILAVPEARR